MIVLISQFSIVYFAVMNAILAYVVAMNAISAVYVALVLYVAVHVAIALNAVSAVLKVAIQLKM